MAKTLSPVESQWIGWVKAVPCVVCANWDLHQNGPTLAHHPREGSGMSQRAGHFLACALCHDHHQGANGIHSLGTRGFETRYKMDEMDAVDMTVRAVFEAMRRAILNGNSNLIPPCLP